MNEKIKKLTKKVLKIFTKNIWIKVFCVLAATLLWFYVAAGQNSAGKFPGSIKIRAINVPSGYAAIYDTKTVNIKIVADSSTWKKLSADSFSASVNLAPYSTAGTYEIAVNVASSVSGVQIVEKNPDKIYVSLESITTKEVDVKQKLEGNVANGMIVNNVDLKTTKVEATGPKSLIEQLSDAIVTIKLNNESENFSKVLKVKALDQDGREINDIDFNPDEIGVLVEVAKASDSKSVGIVVKTSGQVASGYYISNISTNPSIVNIIGSVATLASVNSIETSTIDLANAKSDIEKDVPINLKTGIALLDNSQMKVHIKIQIETSESTKEITSVISTKNLSGYIINSYNPAQVKLIVSGPIDKISDLKNSDVILTLDFSNKTLSNSVEFDLTSSNFSLPNDISILVLETPTIVVSMNKK